MSIEVAAPPHVELVRRFVNTLDVEEATDALSKPDDAAAWFQAQGLLPAGTPVTLDDIALARQLRDGLRDILTSHHDSAPPPPEAVRSLRAAAARAPVIVTLDDDGSTHLEPATDGVAGALARVLAAVHRAALDGAWDRLKICLRDDCRWAFYDASRNRSGKWCTMAVCGNRTKVERFRGHDRA
ncbi:MAG TPA: CGNR zinc finger domain-containing protein [Nitriliruptorales bacterium]